MTQLQGAVGSQMNDQTLNEFLWNLHYKVEAMESWAQSVNESVTDHAERIDLQKSRSFQAFTIVNNQLEELRASTHRGEADTREVMRLVQANDDALKARVEGVITQLDQEVRTLTGTIDSRVRELQAAIAQEKTAPPGDDSSSAAAPVSDLGAIRAEIYAIKRWTSEHERNPTHLLEPQALMHRLLGMENAIGALQRMAQTGAAAPEAPPGMRAGAGTFGSAFGANLEERFNAAHDNDRGSMPQHPRQHDGGSMPQVRGPFNMASGDVPDKLRFDPKLARVDKHLYLDNAPETWHKNVRTYLVGQHIDMKPFLSWIEGRGHTPITAADPESDLGP